MDIEQYGIWPTGVRQANFEKLIWIAAVGDSLVGERLGSG
jgi:hypothetical protein